MKEKQKELHELFKVLADKNRFEIMLQLLEGEKCICQLIMNLKLEQSLVSHHIGILKKHNLIKTRKSSKWTYCHVDLKAIGTIKELFLSTFQRPYGRKILFLCTGNSCRSQIAEGFVNKLTRGRYEAYSAGTRPARKISSLAIKAMSEVGIDISKQRPKAIKQVKGAVFDYVVTLCSDAQENCPYLPAKVKFIHKGFEDPTTSNDINIYRKVRDQIKDFIEETFND